MILLARPMKIQVMDSLTADGFNTSSTNYLSQTQHLSFFFILGISKLDLNARNTLQLQEKSKQKHSDKIQLLIFFLNKRLCRIK